jgi:hypothetical protein
VSACARAASDLPAGLVQISEPLLLATWQHPYAIPACDMQLFLQVSRTFLKDLLWCSDFSYGCQAGDGGLISPLPDSTTPLRNHRLP